MINIFYAREDIDKEKYMYEHVTGEALIVVPDQYTLVGEEQALKYLGRTCLFDIEILSMNRLGLRALTELGEENIAVLGKFERYMLLTKVIREERDNLEIFKTASTKRGFTTMISDFISDLKKQECTIDELDAMIESDAADSVLRQKLSEVRLLAEAYEESLKGKFADNEDYIAKYTEAIGRTSQFKNKEIWVYGYDTLTPKFVGALMSLARVSRGVNIMVGESDFGMEEVVISMLTEAASTLNIPYAIQHITSAEHPAYAYDKSGTIERIERYLFAQGNAGAEECKDFVPVDLRLVKCANTYSEAESAASYVYELLRDHGYRMKDIVIICNDASNLQKVVKRIFDEYGLPLFVDANRGISDSPIAGFVVNLLDAALNDYRTQAILAMMKTGLAGVSIDDAEELENYAKKYHIKGTMWTKPFKYGADNYSDGVLEHLDELRDGVASRLGKLREIAKGAKDFEEFAEEFYRYLQSEWNFKENAKRIADAEFEDNLMEEHQWTTQCYNAAIDILDKARAILGDSEFDLEEFVNIYTEGILGMEVGLIPPTLDGIAMGTMIRTRPSPPKAVIVLGANEGVLPLSPSTEGLFSIDEKAFFAEHDFSLGRLDDIRMKEENVAMYRMMSRASDKIYVSYAMSDANGSDLKPSPIIESIEALFPKAKCDEITRKDIISMGYDTQLMASGVPALRHTINYFKEKPKDMMVEEDRNSDRAGHLADAVMRWYEENDPAVLNGVIEAGCNENEVAPLSRETAKKLFARSDGNFSFSATKLERYNHCPFRFFVNYGLHAEEPREFEGGALEIGDVYHDCIMAVSRRLVEEGILDAPWNGAIAEVACEAAGAASSDVPESVDAVAAGAASSDTPEPSDAGAASSDTQGNGDGREDFFTRERIAEMVSEEITRISETYKEGLFKTNGREVYRLERIEQICLEAIVALAMQMRRGKIKASFFEEKFGRGCVFEPIEYTLHGEKVYIEGKIDRVDILDNDTVRIIDYKTGDDKLELAKMRSGYKMQLMVYMQGAEGRERKPAGMFYFNIAEKYEKIVGKSDDKQSATVQSNDQNRFKLKGAFVNDPVIVDCMPIDVIDVSEDLSKAKDKALAPEVFEELEAEVHEVIERMSDGIISGDIRIEPTKEGSKGSSECKYCQYKPICKFDLTYRSNNYRLV